MRLLAVGILLLALSFACQLIWWRIALPRRQTIALLATFAVAPVVVVGIWALCRHGVQITPPEAARVALFYVAFALAYVVCYSAVENESPTLAIVSYTAGAGRRGRTNDEMYERFGQGEAIAGRFAQMQRGGWIVVDADFVRLSNEGKLYGGLFEWAALVFGIAQGG